MKSTGAHGNDFSRDAASADHHPARRLDDYLETFLVILMISSALLALSLLMPESIAQVVQAFIGFSLSGAMAIMAVLVMLGAAKDL